MFGTAVDIGMVTAVGAEVGTAFVGAYILPP
jgi:hypothetical protein